MVRGAVMSSLGFGVYFMCMRYDSYFTRDSGLQRTTEHWYVQPVACSCLHPHPVAASLPSFVLRPLWYQGSIAAVVWLSIDLLFPSFRRFSVWCLAPLASYFSCPQYPSYVSKPFLLNLGTRQIPALAYDGCASGLWFLVSVVCVCLCQCFPVSVHIWQ